jgi:small subunit ribosomal protein S2
MTKQEENTTNQDIQTLFDLGAHMGHKKSRLHPQASKCVYKIVNGVSIIDLTKTVEDLNEAEKFLASYARQGKKLLVVVTKKVGGSFAADICKENHVAYITNKWLPGLLTNFQTLIKNVQKLKTLKKEKEAGKWDKYVKHEQVKLGKKIAKLQRFYGGIEDMDNLPDVLFVLDIKKESNAVIEAKKNKIPVVAIVDTNSNPDIVDYPVVANDDSPQVVEYLLKRLIAAYASNFNSNPEKKESGPALEGKEVKKQDKKEVVKKDQGDKEKKEPGVESNMKKDITQLEGKQAKKVAKE